MPDGFWPASICDWRRSFCQAQPDLPIGLPLRPPRQNRTVDAQLTRRIYSTKMAKTPGENIGNLRKNTANAANGLIHIPGQAELKRWSRREAGTDSNCSIDGLSSTINPSYWLGFVDPEGFAASFGTRNVPTTIKTTTSLGFRTGCCERRSRGPGASAELLDRA